MVVLKAEESIQHALKIVSSIKYLMLRQFKGYYTVVEFLRDVIDYPLEVRLNLQILENHSILHEFGDEMLLLRDGDSDELDGLADLSIGEWHLLRFLFYFPHHLLFLLGAQFGNNLRLAGLYIIGHGAHRLVLAPMGHQVLEVIFERSL